MSEKLRNLLWPPRKRLYNRPLMKYLKTHLPIPSAYQMFAYLIIFIDTVIMTGEVRIRRIQRLGVMSLVKPPPKLSAEYPVLYIDVGTHRAAAELRWMAERVLPTLCERFTAQGFEAAASLHAEAEKCTAGVPNVQITHLALTDHVPESGMVRLYHNGEDGIGNSLFRDSGRTFEDAPASTLSKWLNDAGLDSGNAICLLRMNVEGAEQGIIADLCGRGLLAIIDGYYGLWDDVGKIDSAAGKAFEADLKHENIAPLSFHDSRDLTHRARRAALKYDFVTALTSGQRRLARHG